MKHRLNLAAALAQALVEEEAHAPMEEAFAARVACRKAVAVALVVVATPEPSAMAVRLLAAAWLALTAADIRLAAAEAVYQAVIDAAEAVEDEMASRD